MAESPVARLSPIARTLRDRGNPPPSPEEEEIEYDTYGWFNFDSDSEGVRSLDRQWVSAHALALVDAAGRKAAIDVWHKKVTPTSTNSREGPVHGCSPALTRAGLGMGRADCSPPLVTS